jgi:hypothetical protein
MRAPRSGVRIVFQSFAHHGSPKSSTMWFDTIVMRCLPFTIWTIGAAGT